MEQNVMLTVTKKPKMKEPKRTVLRTIVGSKYKVEQIENQYIIHYRKMFGENLLNDTFKNIQDIPDVPIINELRFVKEVLPEITNRGERGFRVKYGGKVKEFKSKDALQKMAVWLESEFSCSYLFVWNDIMRMRRTTEYNNVSDLVARIEDDIRVKISNQSLLSK